jgi:predicted transcriptional regulator
MLVPCELVARSIIPALKAIVAKELNNSYGLNQQEIASLLHVSQPAVSHYLHNLRGQAIDLSSIEEISPLLQQVAKGLATSTIPNREVTKIFCHICRIARTRRLLCIFHKERDSSYETDGCDICIP